MTVLAIISATAILILENLINSRIDAYKINLAIKNQETGNTIKHGINFGVYAAVTGLCVWLFHMPLWFAVLFCASAFFNRQIYFDIPLNLRRGLKWFYVSLARPPKALMDRIEVRLFGYNGKAPTICYGILWIATFTLQFFT